MSSAVKQMKPYEVSKPIESSWKIDYLKNA